MSRQFNKPTFLSFFTAFSTAFSFIDLRTVIKMDGVSAAASIVALLTAALQSASAIHAVVSGIRDGPKEVSQLVSALNDLNRELQQLSNIQASRQDGGAEDVSDLGQLVDSCVRDVDRFRRRLAEMQHVSADKTLGRALKQFKLILHKGEFQKMWQTIRDHKEGLSLQLNILQRCEVYPRLISHVFGILTDM
jgi:hypothetical protein